MASAVSRTLGKPMPGPAFLIGTGCGFKSDEAKQVLMEWDFRGRNLKDLFSECTQL